MARGTLTKDIGSTGLQSSWGQIQDDFLTEWRGAEKVKRIDEMLKNSPVIAALRMAIEMPIRDITWQVVSDEGEEDQRIELVQESLDNMTHSWNDHIIDALLMVFYGWSMFTITYERVGGRLLWRKLKMLGHDTVQRWLMEEDGGIAGLQQWPHLYTPEIPIERMVIYRFRKTRNNPEGESVLRPAWIPWYYVKNIQQVEAIGIERNLAGMPIIKPPMGADMTDGGTDSNQAELIIRNVRADEQNGVVLPAPLGEGDHLRWHFELLSPSSSGKVADTNMVISRYEKRMLMASLAQFLMLGQDNVGALATFEGATDFFTMAVNTVADIIAETFSKYAITRLLELNGQDPNGIRLEHSPAGNIGLDVLGTFLQQVGSMITFTADDEVMLRGLIRFPEKEAEELEQMREEERERKAANAQAMQNAFQQSRDDNTLTVAKYRAQNTDELEAAERGFERAYYRANNKIKANLLKDL